MHKKVMLIPIGPIEEELLNHIKNQLPKLINRNVIIGGIIPVPNASYDSYRNQYLGSVFLNALAALDYPDAEKIIGITGVDCYAYGLNFIFGQAIVGGWEAFVAIAHLRQSFYGLPEDVDIFYERVLKELVHELGYTWSLVHCSNPKCVMHFSNSLYDTDVKAAEFCPACKKLLI